MAQSGAAGLLIIVIAIVFGWRAGQAVEARRADVAPVPWVLPAANSANPAQDAAVLRARRPWGGRNAFQDPDMAAPQPAGQPWVLVGTVMRDEQRFALIRVGPPPAGTLEYRAVGDKLPDGSVLDEIDNDSITIAAGPGRGAGRVVYRLFAKKS